MITSVSPCTISLWQAVYRGSGTLCGQNQNVMEGGKKPRNPRSRELGSAAADARALEMLQAKRGTKKGRLAKCGPEFTKVHGGL